MGKERSGIREKTYYCQGTSAAPQPDYIEIDLFPFYDLKYKPCKGARRKTTTPKQKKLNDAKARRYFRLLAKTNFGLNDIHLVLSYDDEHKPESVEAAEKEVKNFIRRLKRRYENKGLKLKYIYITEEGSTNGRIHHHLLINKGVERDVIEQVWGKGYANSTRIQLEHGGIDGLICYLSKDPKGRKRYTPSQNLTKPLESVSDTKTSRRQFQQLTLWPEDCESMKEHFERKHPGYRVVSVEKYYNTITCEWYIRTRMELKEEYRHKRKERRNE